MQQRLITWGMLLVSFSLWGIFGFMVWNLYGERRAHAEASVTASQEATRGESASRLRAAVQSTEAERASLDSLLNISILRAVEILETTARQSGATEASVGEASPTPPAATDPQGLMSVAIVINASGSFTALMRALSLYETLAVPSVLEQFEIEKVDKTWRSTARVRVYLSSEAQ